MSLFGKRKIKIIKENNNGKDEYILDCVKLKEPMNLGEKVILEFMRDNFAWFITDTNFAYEKNEKDIEQNAKNIMERLEEQGILFDVREKIVDKAISLLGISMKKKKVNETKIGMEVTSEVLENLAYIFDNTSVFCYIMEEKKSFEEVLDIHNSITVDGNEYTKLIAENKFQTFLYLDNCFKRIRIATEKTTNSIMISRIVEESYQ